MAESLVVSLVVGRSAKATLLQLEPWQSSAPEHSWVLEGWQVLDGSRVLGGTAENSSTGKAVNLASVAG